MVPRKRGKIIFLEKVVNTHAQKLRHQTNMVPVIKPAQKMDAVAEKVMRNVLFVEDGKSLLSIRGIALPEFLKYPYFNFACVPIFWNGTNNFNSHPGIGFSVDGLNNFAKGSLTQQPDSSIFDNL